MEPTGLEVLGGIYNDDTAAVTGIRFRYENGSTHMRFLVTGLFPQDEDDVARFARDLVRVTGESSRSYRDSVTREAWCYLPERSYLAEFVELSADDMRETGLGSLTLLDNETGCKLRVLSGQPVARQSVAYEDVRGDVMILGVVKGVALPRTFKRLSLPELSATMQAMVKGAVEVYDQWFVLLVCYHDQGPRLLLIFRANVPSGATTVLVNLERAAREVEAGLTLANFKKSIDFMSH